MFKSFNAFVIMLFNGLTDLASAFSHLCKWADETAGSFEDEARIERNARKAALTKAAAAADAQP